MGNKKRPHNFYIEDDIWKKFKMLCIEKDQTATNLIVEFIKKEVEKYGKRNK